MGRTKCKHCNTLATIGALEQVKIQTGGCGEKSLTKVAEFNPDSAQFFQPIDVPRLQTGNLVIEGQSFPAIRRDLRSNDSVSIQLLCLIARLASGSCSGNVNLGTNSDTVTVLGTL